MKYQKLIIKVLTALLISGVAFTGCSKDSGNKIVIKGSTTVLPITQKAAEAYRKIHKTRFSIEGSGSGNGIRAVIDGSCDIGNSSREMKEKEIKKAEKKGAKVKEIVVAYDMIIPIVHPSNPIKNISSNQLKAIYDGSISNWKDLGGKDGKIVVISRDTSSGTYEVWHKLIMKKTDVRKDALLQASNGAIVSVVANNKNAISYVGFGYLTKKISPLQVDGIIGTLENGKSGKFPISRELFMYINTNKISKQAKDFIKFLTGKEGQELVKKAGFIPLKK